MRLCASGFEFMYLEQRWLFAQPFGACDVPEAERDAAVSAIRVSGLGHCSRHKSKLEHICMPCLPCCRRFTHHVGFLQC